MTGRWQRRGKRLVPAWAEPGVRGLYYRIYRMSIRTWCLALSLREKLAPPTPGVHPVPPPLLRFKVGATPSRANFLATGKGCADSLIGALHQVGHPLSESSHLSVLDFGCGCARTLRWIATRFPALELYGIDTDEELIEWCRSHQPYARFSLNHPQPPTPLKEGRFDLIYAISVFTHLDEISLQDWLAEFRRLLKPEGLLVLAVHGEKVWSALEEADRIAVRTEGILTKTSEKLRGFFPDWYQTTFHTEAYLRETCGRHFSELWYLPEEMGYLDLMICRSLW